MLTTLLFLATVARADGLCADDPVAAVEAAMAEIYARYDAMDETGFDRAATQLDAAVSCLDEVPPATTIARLHQTEALVAFVNGQRVATRRAMAAVRLADPAWKPPVDLFPPSHPFRVLWEGATDPGPVQEIGRAPGRAWIVDGVERDEAPTERSFLLQVRGPDGIESSAYLFSFEDIPNRGQQGEVDPWDTPWQVAASAAGAVRVLASEQRARGAGLDDQEGAALGGGALVQVRWTPIAFGGLEVEAGSVGGADPVVGGTFGIEGHAAGLFGAATRFPSGLQLYGAARVGYARDTVVGWAVGADQPLQTLWPVDALLTGAEVGVRNTTLDLRATTDALIAGSQGLYELRPRGTGSIGLAGSWALDLTLGARMGTYAMRDDRDNVLGDRRDTELRFTAGPTYRLR